MRRKYLFVSTSLLVIFSMIAVTAMAMLWKPERQFGMLEIMAPMIHAYSSKKAFNVNPSPLLVHNSNTFAKQEKVLLEARFDSMWKADSMARLYNLDEAVKKPAHNINVLNILVNDSNQIFYYEVANVPIPDSEDWPYNIKVPKVVSLEKQDIHYCTADELMNLLIDFRWKREEEPDRYDCPLVSISLSDNARFDDLAFLVGELNAVDCPRSILRNPFTEELKLINNSNEHYGLSIRDLLRSPHRDMSMRIEGSRKFDRPLYRPLTL